MAKQQIQYSKTPIDIKLTLVPFVIFIFLKIGHTNSTNLIQNTLLMFYIWVFSALFFRPKTVSQILNQKHYYALFGFLIYLFVGLSFANGFFTTVKGVGAYIQIIIPIFMYEFYSIYLTKKGQKILILIILGIYIYFAIKTILYLNINPMAAREMVSIGISDSVMIGGGFSLAYGFSILIPILVYLLINYSKFALKIYLSKLNARIILILIIALFLVVIFKSMFAISFLIALFGSVYVLFQMNKAKKAKKFMLVIATVLIGFVIITVFQLSSFLNSYLGSINTVISRKLMIVLNLFDYSNIEDTGSMGVRFELFMQSINIWLKNFFFGIASENNFSKTRMVTAGLGNHSEWLDLLAQYGLFSIFLMIYLFKSKKSYQNNQGFKMAFILFIILGFLNPINSFNIHFVVFFYVPLLDDYFFTTQSGGMAKL